MITLTATFTESRQPSGGRPRSCTRTEDEHGTQSTKAQEAEDEVERLTLELQTLQETVAALEESCESLQALAQRQGARTSPRRPGEPLWSFAHGGRGSVIGPDQVGEWLRAACTVPEHECVCTELDDIAEKLARFAAHLVRPRAQVGFNHAALRHLGPNQLHLLLDYWANVTPNQEQGRDLRRHADWIILSQPWSFLPQPQ